MKLSAHCILTAFVVLLSLAANQANAQLLSEAARAAIVERLEDVRQRIEATEDAMYKLAEGHDSLVASRDRWYAEMDRVQTEARNAAKDLVQSETRVAEMKRRLSTLQAAAAAQLTDDEQLKALRERKEEHQARLDRATKDSRAKESVRDSIRGEINDAEIEIAQRKESLTLSYIGGQALDLEKRLIELESEMVVRGAMKKLHDDRLAQLKTLSPHVTAYLRLARTVEELQILHRKLADLNAQQQIELLKAIGASKPKVVAARGD